MVVEVDVIIIRALSSLYHFTSSLLQRARRSRDTSTNITTRSSSDGVETKFGPVCRSSPDPASLLRIRCVVEPDGPSSIRIPGLSR